MASDTITLRQKWQLGTEIAKGGFGRVCAAEAADGSQVVIKLVPQVAGASRELLFEPISGLPNIIPILDFGEWQHNYVLVMPRADKSLRQHLNDAGGKVLIDEAVPILLDVAEALASLQQDVVHRDLKPDNVLLYQGHWCLADFGIARYAEATTAQDTHKYSKTAQYAAPEQWRDERATSATDVYAFGVMAFELLQGQRPFIGPDFRVQHLHQAPPPMTGCPPSIVSLVSECLYKAPQARPTPANILTRLRVSQKPPSLADARLQAANQRIVRKQVEEGANVSAQKSLEQQRMELFKVAKDSFSQIPETLKVRILEDAPSALAERGGHVVVSLGQGVLDIDRVIEVTYGSLQSPQRKLPFDVIAYGTIAARKTRDRFGYEGRSHSLWFCDAHDAGVYRWFEMAFMIHPLKHEMAYVNPFALAPTDKDAASVFANSITARQIAWEPIPFDQGEEEKFIERWLGWFADAVDGTLRHPSHMPEESGGRHR